MPTIGEHFFRRHFQIIAFLAVITGGGVLYARALTTNPAGFYVDESSIGYNAYLIAQTGHDEHGEVWPLYFRAFGDYKNPVYIYLLAGIFKATGPSIRVARLLSAFLGFTAALLIGLLAWEVTKRRTVALVVTMTTLLTPWIFELSRVVVEVALYPLLIVLLLLLVHRVSEKERWPWVDSLALALVFALLTYTYSIGRLLGPLLALGLFVFLTRQRVWSIVTAWIFYGLSLVPLLLFQRRHPGALSARYQLLTFITPQTSYAEGALDFVKHYLGNINPWKMIVSGDPNAFQVASVYGVGPMLAVVLIMMLASIGFLLSTNRFNPWWRYVAYGLAVSFVPASLTKDYFHTLRLAAVPVFMLALAFPAFEWITARGTRIRRATLIGSIALILLQGFFFQWKYAASASVPRRLNLFDADYSSTILPTAIARSGNNPVFIADAPPIPGYIQAFWHATIQRMPLQKFTVLPVDAAAPDAAVVITTEDSCPRCEVLFKRWPYTVYIAKGPLRSLAPLPAEAFRAEIRAMDYSPHLRAREAAQIRVAVKNASPVAWLARERAVAPYQISIGNHWLDGAGNLIVNDDGRATLLQDLLPGHEAEFSFTINAPKATGQYILEVDVLQENVSWFGLKGSNTLRLPVNVE
jgi:4-amino-4-deoxy-L-arabinose transferase-like glycosyltransferase